MTTTAPADQQLASAPASPPTSSDRVRDALLAGATVLGPALMMTGIALEVEGASDEAGGARLLEVVAPAADRFYTSNLLGALGLVLLGAGGLAVMRLVRGRGGALATAGGLLALIGAPATAAGLFMYGAVVSVMSEPGLDREAMGALQDRLSEAAQVAPPFIIGFMGSTLALLLLAGALWRARAVARWAPVAIAVGAIAFFFVSSGGVVQALTLTPILAGYAAVAAALLARNRTSVPNGADHRV